jgi:hypothetical protein
VWWAYASTAQSAITATATFTLPTKNVPAPVGDFQVLVLDGARPDQSPAASAASYLINDQSTTPSVTLSTTTSGARVFAVFDDWNSAVTPQPGPDQTLQSVVLNPTDVDGYWVQQKTTPVTTPGPTTMNATVGRNEWHALAWEVLPA